MVFSVPQHDDQSKEHHHEKRFLINRLASEIVFQPLHLDTGTSLHDECVIVF